VGEKGVGEMKEYWGVSWSLIIADRLMLVIAHGKLVRRLLAVNNMHGFSMD
jgi:predicted 3-demethylubiquinone-9 3-methyltransferase (glyoxalase superfamily)